MASSGSVDNSFILSTSNIFFPWPGIWFDLFEFVILLILLSFPFLMYGIIDIWKQVLIGPCYLFFLPSWCLLGFFICNIVCWSTCVSRYPAEFHCFPIFCRFAMVCFSFHTFALVGFCFWSAYRQLLESLNIEKFFPFVVEILLRTRCIACVSAVNIELDFLVMQILCSFQW